MFTLSNGSLTQWGTIQFTFFSLNIPRIDPSDPICDPYYEKMKELHMVLLCHTGMEHAVDPPGIDNGLGNPLRLRRPLNQGTPLVTLPDCTRSLCDCCTLRQRRRR